LCEPVLAWLRARVVSLSLTIGPPIEDLSLRDMGIRAF
jgi:hypothetical protein